MRLHMEDCNKEAERVKGLTEGGVDVVNGGDDVNAAGGRQHAQDTLDLV